MLPDEGLEGGALGVDAQGDSLPLLVVRDETMDELWGERDIYHSVCVCVCVVCVCERVCVCVCTRDEAMDELWGERDIYYCVCVCVCVCVWVCVGERGVVDVESVDMD